MNVYSLPNNLIVFDGVCKFCNASVNFIIRHAPNTAFYFATTQSQTGAAVLEHLGLEPTDPTTFVLLKDGAAFTQSNAALEIAKKLTRPWSYLRVLRFLPKVIRDSAYTHIAQNRYRILGKLDRCMVPTQAVKSRFLD